MIMIYYYQNSKIRIIIVAVLSSSIERLDTDWFVGRGRIQKNTSISYFGGRRQRIAHAKIQIFPSSVRSVLFLIFCLCGSPFVIGSDISHARAQTYERIHVEVGTTVLLAINQKSR